MRFVQIAGEKLNRAQTFSSFTCPHTNRFRVTRVSRAFSGLLVRLTLGTCVRRAPTGLSPSQQERTRSTRSLSTPTGRFCTPRLETQSEFGICEGEQEKTFKQTAMLPVDHVRAFVCSNFSFFSLLCFVESGR